ALEEGADGLGALLVHIVEEARDRAEGGRDLDRHGRVLQGLAEERGERGLAADPRQPGRTHEAQVAGALAAFLEHVEMGWGGGHPAGRLAPEADLPADAAAEADDAEEAERGEDDKGSSGGAQEDGPVAALGLEDVAGPRDQAALLEDLGSEEVAEE